MLDAEIQVCDRIQLNPAVRLMPPSQLSEGGWAVESLVGPRYWTISKPALVLLLACIEQGTRNGALDRAASLTGMERARLASMLIELETSGMLFSSGSAHSDLQQIELYDDVRKSWARVNWTEAAEYHLATLDYPFPDYATTGRQLDTARMRAYIADEPDVDRYKTLPSSAVRIELPTPAASLAPGSLSEALRQFNDQSPPDCLPSMDAQLVLDLMSIAFGEIGRIAGGRWPRSPMLRRTSPSGGGRHPCEAYLLIIDIPGLAPGWYHVGVSPAELSQIRPAKLSDAELRKLFPLGYGRASFGVKCIVAVTTIFERNMYRYREPRTFRTVHMDAGHLATSLGLAAAARGIMTHAAYSDDDEEIEQSIGVNGLDEGYMLTVSLGTSSRNLG